MRGSQQADTDDAVNSGIVLQDIEVSLKTKIVSRPLNSKWRLEKYPDTYMPFYLYGTGTFSSSYPVGPGRRCDSATDRETPASEANIDHVIVRAPNTQLSAGRCRLHFYQEFKDNIWENDLILLMENVREEPMQPFPPNSEIGSKNGAIVAHKSYHADLKKAAKQGDESNVSSGNADGNQVKSRAY